MKQSKSVESALLIIFAASALAACSRDFRATDVKIDNDEKKASYALGRSVGVGLHSQGLKIDRQSFLAGILDGMDNKNQLTAEEIRQGMLNIHDQNVRLKDAKVGDQLSKIAAENLKVSASFIKEQSKKAGMSKTKSGLIYRMITAGSGRNVQETDQIMIHYNGKLHDGQVFDSTFSRGQPSQLFVKDLVPGWREALGMMKAGAKMEVIIPPDLAFGEAGAGAIGPNTALHIEMEVLQIL